jgi:hypothetical protein
VEVHFLQPGVGEIGQPEVHPMQVERRVCRHDGAPAQHCHSSLYIWGTLSQID